MSRKVQRVNFHLDAKGIGQLPFPDIQVILRGADALIGAGGRTLLTKILRGSRAKDVLGRNLDKNPAYGVYRELTEEETLARIDWMILNDYLRFIFDGRLPLLAYTASGWNIERETFADELCQGFDRLLSTSQRPYDMNYLKDRDRELIWRVLEKVEASGNLKYIPVLEDWQQVDYKKVKQRIKEVIQSLNDRAQASV
jgi:RQC domain